MCFAFAFSVVVFFLFSLSLIQSTIFLLCKPTHNMLASDAYIITCVLKGACAFISIWFGLFSLAIYARALEKNLFVYIWNWANIVSHLLIHLRNPIFINFYFRLSVLRRDHCSSCVRECVWVTPIEFTQQNSISSVEMLIEPDFTKCK